MPRKTKVDKNALSKEITDVSWGQNTGIANVTVEGLRAIDKSLTPNEAFQLSIDLKTALEARATIARAKYRFFHRKSGDEILEGELIDLIRTPAPGWTTYQFTRTLIMYYHLAGEMAISLLEKGEPIDNGTRTTPIRKIAGLYPLNPFRLQIINPILANDHQQIREWRYIWPNGMITLLGKDNLLFTCNFNPLSHTRGMAPALAGINEISANWQAVKYNAKFFQNNAMPNHVVVLPPGTTREQKEAFKDEYIAMHSTYAGQSHKAVFVVANKEFQILPIETKVKDGQFLDLMKLSSAKINKLYHVPPVLGGDWDSTRFDSVDIQREVYMDEALIPDMEMISQFLQVQLVDRFFRLSEFERSTKPKLTKFAKEAFDYAREVNGGSDIIIILDPDSLPIAGKLKQHRVDYAQKLQDTFKITPQEAAIETGFEFDDNDANTLVWHNSTTQPFGKETPEEQISPLDNAEAELMEQEPHDNEQEEQEQEEKDTAKAFKDFYRAFRKMILDKVDNGKLFRLQEVDLLIKNTFDKEVLVLSSEIRKDYAVLYQQFKVEKDIPARKQLVKQLLNGKNRTYFKGLSKNATSYSER